MLVLAVVFLPVFYQGPAPGRATIHSRPPSIPIRARSLLYHIGRPVVDSRGAPRLTAARKKCLFAMCSQILLRAGQGQQSRRAPNLRDDRVSHGSSHAVLGCLLQKPRALGGMGSETEL